MPLAAIDLVGVDALRQLAPAPATRRSGRRDASPPSGGVDALVDALAAAGPGVTLVTGKGGVGKTTIAVRIAAGLAQRGLAVHLATTDPAGRLPTPGGVDLPDSVTVSRIDPDAETARYAAEQPRRTAQRSASWPPRICARRAPPRSPCSGPSAGSSASAAPSTS